MIRTSGCVVAGLLFPLALLTGCAAQPKRALDQSQRAKPAGRELVILVPQGEIAANITPSTAGAAFGLIGALIDAGVNQSRASTAEESVRPVRNALSLYDFDRLAKDSLDKTMRSVPWLGVTKTSFFKERTPARFNQSLDASSTDQVVFTNVEYGLNNGFRNLYVSWDVNLVNKSAPAGKKPEARLEPANFAFSNLYLCSVSRTALADGPGYASMWAQSEGKDIKDSVGRCMSALDTMVKRNLEMTPQDIEQQTATLKRQQVENIGGQSGKVVERNPQYVLMNDVFGRWIVVLPAV